MRQLFQTFEKSHALRDELTWTHYQILLKVEKDNAREFYMKEAIAGNWSTRQLERQINSLYFDRLLMSNGRKSLDDVMAALAASDDAITLGAFAAIVRQLAGADAEALSASNLPGCEI